MNYNLITKYLKLQSQELIDKISTQEDLYKSWINDTPIVMERTLKHCQYNELDYESQVEKIRQELEDLLYIKSWLDSEIHSNEQLLKLS